jgi:hypothetical protein
MCPLHKNRTAIKMPFLRFLFVAHTWCFESTGPGPGGPGPSGLPGTTALIRISSEISIRRQDEHVCRNDADMLRIWIPLLPNENFDAYQVNAATTE